MLEKHQVGRVREEACAKTHLVEFSKGVMAGRPTLDNLHLSVGLAYVNRCADPERVCLRAPCADAARVSCVGGAWRAFIPKRVADRYACA